jgi:hypothetical protein
MYPKVLLVQVLMFGKTLPVCTIAAERGGAKIAKPHNNAQAQQTFRTTMRRYLFVPKAKRPTIEKMNGVDYSK